MLSHDFSLTVCFWIVFRNIVFSSLFLMHKCIFDTQPFSSIKYVFSAEDNDITRLCTWDVGEKYLRTFTFSSFQKHFMTVFVFWHSSYFQNQTFDSLVNCIARTIKRHSNPGSRICTWSSHLLLYISKVFSWCSTCANCFKNIRCLFLYVLFQNTKKFTFNVQLVRITL